MHLQLPFVPRPMMMNFYSRNLGPDIKTPQKSAKGGASGEKHTSSYDAQIRVRSRIGQKKPGDWKMAKSQRERRRPESVQRAMTGSSHGAPRLIDVLAVLKRIRKQSLHPLCDHNHCLIRHLFCRDRFRPPTPLHNGPKDRPTRRHRHCFHWHAL